jgi:hypothetical protein
MRLVAEARGGGSAHVQLLEDRLRITRRGIWTTALPQEVEYPLAAIRGVALAPPSLLSRGQMLLRVVGEPELPAGRTSNLSQPFAVTIPLGRYAEFEALARALEGLIARESAQVR